MSPGRARPPCGPNRSRWKVKVILLGSYEAFEFLQNYDPKFNKIFKVRADFDQEVERTPATTQLYAQFLARVCREEKLLPFTRRGVAAIVEFGEKYVSDQNKLSIRFGPLLGVLKEADYWARRQRARVVSEKHVVRAFQEHRFRYNLYEQKIHESYRDGTIMIDVARRRGRPDQRPGGLPDRRLFLRPAGAHHGRNVHGQTGGRSTSSARRI